MSAVRAVSISGKQHEAGVPHVGRPPVLIRFRFCLPTVRISLKHLSSGAAKAFSISPFSSLLERLVFFCSLDYEHL